MANQSDGWRPGFRHKTTTTVKGGRISNPNTAILLSTDTVSGTVQLTPMQDPDMPEGWGADVTVTLVKNANFIKFDPTHMTVDELQKLRDFMNLMFELVIPVAQRRDEIAEQGRQEGDDAYTRLYRQTPRLSVRQEQIRKYDQGVFDRCPGVLERRGSNGNPSVGSGTPAAAVAEPEQDEVGGPNIQPEDNSREGLLSDGWH